ncbi:MAG: hypothetical protein EVA87_09620 [Rhodospirillaceae bacterium]|nr:hypothetical protein [Rhodospirillaceae bacterium]RPG00057.1 MAG: hypothetical protein CBC23_006385 [Rhodospirillaceae bacterium TMED63]RZO36565.1 MAG: hypothetical protein EVA87_09620 [Rhodospirillaceae bacterium]
MICSAVALAALCAAAGGCAQPADQKVPPEMAAKVDSIELVPNHGHERDLALNQLSFRNRFSVCGYHEVSKFTR